MANALFHSRRPLSAVEVIFDNDEVSNSTFHIFCDDEDDSTIRTSTTGNRSRKSHQRQYPYQYSARQEISPPTFSRKFISDTHAKVNENIDGSSKRKMTRNIPSPPTIRRSLEQRSSSTPHLFLSYAADHITLQRNLSGNQEISQSPEKSQDNVISLEDFELFCKTTLDKSPRKLSDASLTAAAKAFHNAAKESLAVNKGNVSANLSGLQTVVEEAVSETPGIENIKLENDRSATANTALIKENMFLRMAVKELIGVLQDNTETVGHMSAEQRDSEVQTNADLDSSSTLTPHSQAESPNSPGTLANHAKGISWQIESSDGKILCGKYTGGLVEGVPSGNGVLRFLNGDLYIGDFRNGQMHGEGVFYSRRSVRSNLEIRRGIFQSNEFVGKGSSSPKHQVIKA